MANSNLIWVRNDGIPISSQEKACHRSSRRRRRSLPAASSAQPCTAHTHHSGSSSLGQQSDAVAPTGTDADRHKTRRTETPPNFWPQAQIRSQDQFSQDKRQARRDGKEKVTIRRHPQALLRFRRTRQIVRAAAPDSPEQWQQRHRRALQSARGQRRHKQVFQGALCPP